MKSKRPRGDVIQNLGFGRETYEVVPIAALRFLVGMGSDNQNNKMHKLRFESKMRNRTARHLGERMYRAIERGQAAFVFELICCAMIYHQYLSQKL